jgi:membrane-associated phospholipid phosphatase
MTPVDRLHMAADALGDFAGWVARTTRRWPLTGGLVHVVLFCLLSYALLDRPLALAFKAHLGPQTEGFFKVVTTLGLGGVWLVPGVLIWAYCRWRQHQAVYFYVESRYRSFAHAAGFFVLSGAASGIVGNLVKFGVGRYRPRALFDQGIYGFSPFNTDWVTNSFPSGHSQAAFAAMTALVVILPRYDLLWLLIAVLVAVSRVATSVHYLSDVAMGSYLGIAGTVLLHRLYLARGIDVRLRFARDKHLAD